MEFLTKKECVNWCKEHTIKVAECPMPDGYSLSFPIPKIAGVQGALSRSLIEWFGDYDEVLFWVTDWPLYKADEMELFLSIRKGQAENRDLIQAPGCIIVKKDEEKIKGYIFLMMAFLWDSYLIASDNTAIFTSHEEYMDMISQDKHKHDQIKAILESFDIKPIRD